jgi:two-component system, OmpR family, phosphate regulon sensor histidine kinase PhoR
METRDRQFNVLAATGALAAPAALVFVGLALTGHIAWPWAAIGAALSALGVGAMVRRHVTALERHARRLRELAHGEPANPLPVVDSEGPAGIVAEAMGDLERALPERAGPEAREAALESIVDALPYAVLQLGRGENILRANAAARAFFGEAPENKPLVAFLRDPDLLDAVAEALEGGYPDAVDVTLAGAVERALRARAVPLIPGGVLLALADVTTVVRAERMRRDFVANVSHELRTPLATLAGFIETLQGPAKDDATARARFLGIMAQQSARMTRIVTDLLSLSKIEESEHTPPSSRVDAARLAQSTVDSLAPQVKAKQTRIEISVASNLPPLLGDSDQLAQVFQNLIDNAIKYGRAGGTVRVRLARAEAPPAGFAPRHKSYLMFEVRDDGDGIAREHLPRLTERFYRVDAGRSRDMGGTGLGLAIVKHIVNRHRGTLDIDSEPGQGSTFAVYLPVAEEPAKVS